jgi:pimeloyl-ACP methyl ester carboxylesterase
MSITHDDWSVPSDSGEPLRASSHIPASPRAHLVFAHGLKGFKDYGFIPVLCERLARESDIAAHRFNLSHSGIGDDATTFQRPDLFERDTWRTQARDILAMMRAVRDRAPSLSIILAGHSRGGASSLLAAAECFDRSNEPPHAIISISAPSSLNRLSESDREKLLSTGVLDMPSARTGQMLRVGRAWLQDQLDDPDWHHLPRRCASIRCPTLITHGGADATVLPADARTLANAIPNSIYTIIEGADHVWNVTHPAQRAEFESPNPKLRALLDAINRFLNDAI